jgi:hypothetical protein
LKPARKQLLVVFLAVTVVPATLAGWLAWRLLAQDRIMAGERLREIRESRADEVVQSLSRALAALARDARGQPALAYAPQPRPLPEAPARIFSAGEQAASAKDVLRTRLRLSQAGETAAAGCPRARGCDWRGRENGRREEALRHSSFAQLDAAAGARLRSGGQWAICTMQEAAAELKGGRNPRAWLDSGRFSSVATFTRRTPIRRALGGKPSRRGEAPPTPRHPGPPAPGPAVPRSRITWIAADNNTVLLTPDQVQRLLPAGAVRVRFASQAGKDELAPGRETGLPWTLAIALADPEKERKPSPFAASCCSGSSAW